MGPGAGFGFALLFIFPMGEASVVAEGRGVALKVSVILGRDYRVERVSRYQRVPSDYRRLMR